MGKLTVAAFLVIADGYGFAQGSDSTPMTIPLKGLVAG